jgi:hypothetical protein
VRWQLQSLNVGWPPSATLVLGKGDEEALNELFAAIEDKRVLRHGYAPRSGIEDLKDLRGRVDQLRGPLQVCLTDLGNAPVGEWIRKLQEACDELVSEISMLLYEGRETPKRSEVEPAVEELRQAFRLMARRLSAKYHLTAAESLAGRIQTHP